ncbi:MAG: hypothetical protein U0572_08700 [Phycisphaerales bacterium]
MESTQSGRVFGALASLFVSSLACAGTATFQMIPNAYSANDMSPDGRYVVGGLNGGHAYIFDTVLNQFTELPAGCEEGLAVSDDGKTVIGNYFDPALNDKVAAIWTQASGVWTSMGSLPTGGSCPGLSSAYELSADGSVAVGLAWIDGCHGTGFRWTQANGMQPLEVLANGANRASVVSANGNIIGGFAQGSFSRTPAIWAANGQGELLDPPNGDALGEVFGMNDSGSIWLGTWNGKAVMWTNGGAVQNQIGAGAMLPGWQGTPMDIANNGTVVGFDFLIGNRRAWIRPGSSGPLVDLKEYLEANGAVVGEEMWLDVCQAISTDATKIVGHTGFVGAWIATITAPSTCPGDIAPAGGDGQVNGSDLGALLGAWGGPGGDLDGDGVTSASDLGILLGSWGACPPASGACCLGGDCSQLSASECAAAGGTYLGDNVPCTLMGCSNNDLCADAIDITDMIDGPIILGDNSTATPPALVGGDPELPAGSPSCQWAGEPQAAHSTVWYKFTAPWLGVVTVSLCDSVPVPFVDSSMTLYSGQCGSLVEIACAEDECGEIPGSFPYYSRLFAEHLTPGATYYICVMNSGGWAGSVPGPFKMTITSP